MCKCGQNCNIFTHSGVLHMYSTNGSVSWKLSKVAGVIKCSYLSGTITESLQKHQSCANHTTGHVSPQFRTCHNNFFKSIISKVINFRSPLPTWVKQSGLVSQKFFPSQGGVRASEGEVLLHPIPSSTHMREFRIPIPPPHPSLLIEHWRHNDGH